MRPSPLSCRRHAGFLLVLWMCLASTPLMASPPDLPVLVAGCEDLEERLARGGGAPKVEPVGGGDVWHVAWSSTDRWLVWPGEECRSRRVGRAAMRATAELLASNPGKEKAYFLVPPDGCEGCGMVAAVRGKAETPLVARWMDDGCDAGGRVESVRLFPGADALAVRCRESMGAGWRETLLLLDGDLRVLLRAPMGFHEPPTDEERRAGRCAAQPAGWFKVLSRGDRPVIEVLSPESDDMEDGRGVASVWCQEWDPGSRQFVRIGEPRPVPFDMRARCR